MNIRQPDRVWSFSRRSKRPFKTLASTRNVGLSSREMFVAAWRCFRDTEVVPKVLGACSNPWKSTRYDNGSFCVPVYPAILKLTKNRGKNRGHRNSAFSRLYRPEAMRYDAPSKVDVVLGVAGVTGTQKLSRKSSAHVPIPGNQRIMTTDRSVSPFTPWIEEADRRYREYKSGKIPARSAQEILSDARNAIS